MSLFAQIPDFDELSTADRLRLIEKLWDSIPDDRESMEVPQRHKEELDRRLEAMKDDPLAGSSWADVKARLQGRPRDSR